MELNYDCSKMQKELYLYEVNRKQIAFDSLEVTIIILYCTGTVGNCNETVPLLDDKSETAAFNQP